MNNRFIYILVENNVNRFINKCMMYEIDLHDLKYLDKNKLIVKIDKNDLSDKSKEGYIEISAKEGKGIDKVKKAVSEIIGNTEYPAFIANERQYEAVVKAAESIEKAKSTVEDGFFSDLAAIDISNAVAYLGEAEGISINQETVDRIFEKFCLGK